MDEEAKLAAKKETAKTNKVIKPRMLIYRKPAPGDDEQLLEEGTLHGGGEIASRRDN